MNAEQFHSLVERLQQDAGRNRAAYRRRVVLVALLGYGYLAIVLTGILGALAFLAWLTVSGTLRAAYIKLAIPLLLLAAAILRSLWVRFDAPDGIPLSRGSAPQVFAMVEDLVARLQTPRFNDVLVTLDFNAAVVQTPRLGFFGWYRNALLLGLPLMAALSPEEFRAVLAHEMGHLSHQHGRIATWIYRMRVMWMRLTQQLESQRHWGYHVFDWFLSRWAPYFNAYSFVLAREHEYEADRFAAELAGPGTLGLALQRSEVMGTYLGERLWPGILKEVESSADAPAGVPARLGHDLGGGAPGDDARRWLADALAHETGSSDTHPSLADRLRALAVSPPSDLALPPIERAAAAAYLGAEQARLLGALDEDWRRDSAHGWRERHEQVVEGRRRLAHLEEQARSGALADGLAWERAELTLELDGPERAEPLLREILEQRPQHAAANWILGRLLLHRDDEAGVALIERAVAADAAARVEGHDLIRRFWERRGDAATAQRYQKQVWQGSDLLTQAEEERRTAQGRDAYLAHELDAEAVAGVRNALERVPEVREAYAGRKDVRYFPDRPLFVLVVRVANPWYRFRSGDWAAGVLQRVAQSVPMPGEWLAVAWAGEGGAIARKLKAFPGSLIFRRA